ncbi:hypothetical protein [Tardiphaga sp.]|uniref:hypothetical protein n=1 Tax=Tardiphaga sp. TaxID=1926292 RepID=UPI0026286355|nr:hypothetical protein [Tardiphaga sp.]
MAWIGVIFAGLLGGCVRDPYVGAEGDTRSAEWYIAHQVDRVTGTELPSAAVHGWGSNSYVDFPKISQFQLTCFDGHPLVRFAFAFKIGNDRESVFGYRFDDRPGHAGVEARVVKGQPMLVLEEPAALATFLSELPGSRKLYIRIRSLIAGRTSAEYPLEGSEAAIKAAFANCPMPALPAKRTS